MTESEARRAIIVFQRQKIKCAAEKYARPSGEARIRLGSAETETRVTWEKEAESSGWMQSGGHCGWLRR